MNNQLYALKAEFIKIRHSKIVLISFIAFSLIPVMGGVFMLIMQSPGAMEKASLLNTKMEAMKVTADWNALFMILTQGLGIAGIMLYGFIVSWIFGREYSDNTVKDLLSLPTSKTKILNAKYITYFIWSAALAIFNVLLGMTIGFILQLPGFAGSKLYEFLLDYGFTAFLTILLGMPIAFFSMWGKGYLAPLGCVALVLIFSQILAAVGYGQYFPWAVPALFSGVGGEYKEQLNMASYFILVAVSIAGYCVTILYWKQADHQK